MHIDTDARRIDNTGAQTDAQAQALRQTQTHTTQTFRHTGTQMHSHIDRHIIMFLFFVLSLC